MGYLLRSYDFLYDANVNLLDILKKFFTDEDIFFVGNL